MGALRFCGADGTFLANEALSAPPVTMIGDLQEVALELSKKRQDDLGKVKEWLKVLVAPGASLGGACPKANIREMDGSLWIAKFPSADDDYDSALWEKLLHDMAGQCGISVPPSRVMQIGREHHTFLVKRFDRSGEDRHFFTSAMTMLHRQDSDDASYLELAEFLANYGVASTIDRDLQELFTRVVFNVVTANRDDHLRNQGFQRYPDGWRLSPAYDMNPSLSGKPEHVLALDDHVRLPDLGTVLSTAEYYRLQKALAEKIIERVLTVVGKWRTHAKRLQLSAAECAQAGELFQKG